jgi:hypothetical protein
MGFLIRLGADELGFIGELFVLENYSSVAYGATFPHKGRLLTLLPSIVAGENCAYFKLYAALSVYCQVFRVCEPSLVREGGPLAVDE